MARGMAARLSVAEGRRFGLTVGTAFLMLSAVLWWRVGPTVAVWLAALGAALLLSGLTVPSRLGYVKRTWMALALAISKVTTPTILGAFYFLVLTPAGWLRRTIGRSPLAHEKSSASLWVARKSRASDLERQF